MNVRHLAQPGLQAISGREPLVAGASRFVFGSGVGFGWAWAVGIERRERRSGATGRMCIVAALRLRLRLSLHLKVGFEVVVLGFEGGVDVVSQWSGGQQGGL